MAKEGDRNPKPNAQGDVGIEFLPPFVYPRDARIAVFVLKQIRNANPDHGSLTLDQAIDLFSAGDDDALVQGPRLSSVTPTETEYANRNDAVFFTLLAENAEGSNWKFPSLYDPLTLNQIYPDKLQGLTHEEYARTTNGLRGRAHTTRSQLVRQIAEIDSQIPSVKKHIQALLEAARKNPRLNRASNEDIIGYLIRSLPFPALPEMEEADSISPFLQHLLEIRYEVRHPRIGTRDKSDK